MSAGVPLSQLRHSLVQVESVTALGDPVRSEKDSPPTPPIVMLRRRGLGGAEWI